MILLLLILLSFQPTTLPAGDSTATSIVRVELKKSASALWLEGSTNVGGFRCVAKDMAGAGTYPVVATDGDQRRPPSVRITVPIALLDCGKSAMNRDLRRAMKADEHPFIHFDLDRVEVEESHTDVQANVRVYGRLQIAGVAQVVETTAETVYTGTAYHAKGELPLTMTSYGIDPPATLLGLVKAHDEIVVRFELVGVLTRRPTSRTYSDAAGG